MYKLIIETNILGTSTTIYRIQDNTYIPCDPDNTDYQKFKIKINDDKATLQDADGNTMTAEEAKQFIATLP